MNVYSIDVKVYATAYIKAETEQDARKIAEELKGYALELPEGGAGDLEISGMQLDNPDLPDVSLSPAMTVYGPDPDTNIELSEEDV